MDYNCTYILPKQFIITQLKGNHTLLAKYDKFSIKKIIANDTNMKFCPIPNCEGFGKRKNKKEKYITCSEGHKFCFHCLKKWHGWKSCQNEIDKDFEKYKKSKLLKKCPKCKYWTEKFSGCNHMKCQSCKYEWCWICRQHYDSNHYQIGLCKGFQFSKYNYLII